MDREAWHAAIHGVAKSRTWQSNWTELDWTFSCYGCSAASCNFGVLTGEDEHTSFYTTIFIHRTFTYICKWLFKKFQPHYVLRIIPNIYRHRMACQYPSMEDRSCPWTPSFNNTWEDSIHGHHQVVNTEIRLIIFFAAKDGEALYSQQKQGQELSVAQFMNSLLPNSDLNWRK